MPAAKKTGYSVRTAYPGDVFHAGPELVVTDEGTFIKDKLVEALTEAQTAELVDQARSHAVVLQVTDLAVAVEPEQKGE